MLVLRLCRSTDGGVECANRVNIGVYFEVLVEPKKRNGTMAYA